MRAPAKHPRKPSAKRNLFAELMEGMEALAEARQGKRTLCTHDMELKSAATLTPQEVIRK